MQNILGNLYRVQTKFYQFNFANRILYFE